MPDTVMHKNESSNYFEAIFNYAPIGIVIVDITGKITAVNPYALKEFDYCEAELLDMSIDKLIPQRFHEKHTSHHKQYFDNPRSRPMGSGRDLFAIKKDGTEFPVEISLGYYQEAGAKYVYVMAFISNITIRKKAETEIKKLNDELEATVEQRTRELTATMHQLEHSKDVLSLSLKNEKELSELKSRFVSMASHEFRTPLSTVLSSAYLIEKYNTTEDQPKRERHLQYIVSSVNMLTDILNDFLSLGKIEEGKIQVRFTELNIQELVTTIAGELQHSLKKQQKIYYMHEGVPLVSLDGSLLKHIIMNLVSNASKFSSQTSAIEIRTTHFENKVTLSVKDYGIGISKADQEHLMERFFRGTNAGTIQGTGLGLHIVSKYAELMNGTVECKSELQKGSEFVINFNIKTN
jgi:PAS domain S-box-containing protein